MIKRQCICVIGAGGKTSLIRLLMDKYKDRKVIVSTTGHMERPACMLVEKEDVNQVQKALMHENVIACVHDSRRGVTGFTKECLRQLYPLCDLMLIEADGNHNHPFKVDRDHEPSLVDFMTLGIAVLSMSAYGQSFAEAAYPAAFSAEYCQCKINDPIDEAAFIKAAKQLISRFNKTASCLLLTHCSKQTAAAARAVRRALDVEVIIWWEGEKEYEENSLCL